MPKKSTKSRSKRVTLHQKYKVLKKIKEHHRKKAKELKKKGGRVKPPKDPGIPAAWPFKEQLLQEIEFERQKAELAKQARKDAAKERRVRCAFVLRCAADSAARSRRPARRARHMMPQHGSARTACGHARCAEWRLQPWNAAAAAAFCAPC